MKYTKEILTDAVANSTSFAGVLRFLNLKQAGGTQAHIKRKIRTFGIDTSHFTGQAHQRGCPAYNKLPWQHFLVQKTDGGRTKAEILRRALIESGVKYQCKKCGNVGEWLGKELTLEVDHINGDFTDNRRKNLRFLCPNCHSQEPIIRCGQTYM